MRHFFNDFSDGISAYSEAFRLLKAKRLWGYVILPGIVSLAFGVLIIFAGWKISGPLSGFVTERYPFEFGSESIKTIARVVSIAALVVLGYISYKYIVQILVAPFMSPLSETVENHLTGNAKRAAFDPLTMLSEMWRGIRVSLRNIIRELFLTFLLFIVGFIPVIGLISGPAIFIVQAYYAGFGNMDYTLERHFNVRASARFVRSFRGLAVANGTVFLLILMIPVVGLFFAPSLATIAGAVETVRRLDP